MTNEEFRKFIKEHKDVVAKYSLGELRYILRYGHIFVHYDFNGETSHLCNVDEPDLDIFVAPSEIIELYKTPNTPRQ